MPQYTQPIQASHNSTLWIFIVSTENKDIVRHATDIVFSVHTLRQLGVPKDHIYIFINDKFVNLMSDFLIDHNVDSHVHNLTQLNNVLTNLNLNITLAMMVIGGHGSPRGIHYSGNVYSPNDLITTLRSVRNVQYASMILCQCYSGIFNYLDASSTPPIFLMAGTNLKLSLSLNIELQNPLRSVSTKTDIQKWAANPFQYYFFEWLSNPMDIDGDGVCNIIDGFKYASSLTNQKTIGIKGSMLVVLSHAIDEHRSLLKKRCKSEKVNKRINDLDQLINSIPQNLYNVESPWLLNPLFGKWINF